MRPTSTSGTRYWGDEPRFGGCLLCQQLGARLERFIGTSEARRIRRMTKRDARVRASAAKVFRTRRRLMERLAK